MQNTIDRFAEGLKARLREKDEFSGLADGDYCYDCNIKWETLDRAIDEFCAEFQKPVKQGTEMPPTANPYGTVVSGPENQAECQGSWDPVTGFRYTKTGK